MARTSRSRPGCQPRATRAVLHEQAYEVIPVRPDLADVAGMKSYEKLPDVPGPVDIVVLFRNAPWAPDHIRETAVKAPEAVWLPPGVWSRACDDAAAQLGITLVMESCIEEEHRHASRAPGHPTKLGVHVRRGRSTYEDNRKHPEDAGYVAGGGGGASGGGGVRAVLDEKKMMTGRPSPRSGILKMVPRLRLRGRHRAK